MPAALRELKWWRATALAVALHLPFVIGLLSAAPPAWLDTAWQVSATLVGLGIAVVVFLLQAAGSQSLSSDATYRSLLGYSLLIWPATLAMAFLVAVPVVERYGSDGTAPAWANTWALAAFAAQIVGFGVSFARTAGIVSAAGVRKVLEQAFHDAMRAAVTADLLRKLMLRDLHELCANRVSYGRFLTRGAPLLPRRTGIVIDVDRELPASLDGRQLGERVTLTLDPGRPVSAGAPLAKLEGVGESSVSRDIRRAVVIRKLEPPPSPVPVFEDVLDVARRALGMGSRANFQSAAQLIVDCVAELPAAYARWGAQYTLDYVGEPLAPGTEQEILRSLASFSDEVFRSQRREPAELMPQIAGGLVDAGLREDAPLLVTQATSLWRRQLQTASDVADSELESDLHDQVGRLAAQAVLAHQYGLEDRDRPLAHRLAAEEGLKLLFQHQIRVLKYYLDARQITRFSAAWRRWIEWARDWNPEHDLEDLKLQVSITTGTEQRETGRRLEAAEALVDAKRRLETERTSLMMALGTWALHRRRQEQLSREEWRQLLPYLVGAAPDADAAARLLVVTWSEPHIGLVETWQRQAWDGETDWHPANAQLVARLWATLLLLRAMPTAFPSPEIDLGALGPQVSPEVIAQIKAIVSDSHLWDETVGGQLAARAAIARVAVEAAGQRQAAQAERALASAPLDPDKVNSYAALQRRTYNERDYLRKALDRAGAIERRSTDAAFDEDVLGWLVPKRPFADIEGPEIVIGLELPARQLASDQIEATYTAIAEIAPAWTSDDESAEAAV